MGRTRHQQLAGTDGRGSIHNREAYLREKTLDHSGWLALLPRNITPSDIDAAVDDAGRILLIEMSCVTCDWNDIPDGQHNLYRSLVRAGRGLITAVIAQHRTTTGRDIDTVDNVIGFTVMYHQPGDLLAINDIRYNTYLGNDNWRKFIQEWAKW